MNQYTRQDQTLLQAFAEELAAVVCQRLPATLTNVQLHTEMVQMGSHTEISVIASHAQRGAVFRLNMQVNKHLQLLYPET